MASVGFGEPALKELHTSHPAFAHVVAAQKASERTYAVVKQFDRKFFRRRQEAEKLSNIPETKD